MRKMLIPLAALILFAGPALAASPTFDDVDEDDNDLITLVEAQAANDGWTEETFQEADQDDDAALDEAEYDAAIESRPKAQ